ncbi:MAG: beta-galactosidase [Verrucomicrobiota bacterium]
MATSNILLLGCFLAAAVPVPATAAESGQTLPSCSIGYGYLMADHWLTVDLERQIERGLSYLHAAETNKPGSEFEQLRQSIEGVEGGLLKAGDLYKLLFATNTVEGVIQLSALLEQISVSETNIERSAIALLQHLGERSIGPSFQALPISNNDLGPAWPAEAPPSPAQQGRGVHIDDKYRPNRILFGSTGKSGDDRTLPLRFDFGSGVFGFYIPMAASNKLDIAAPIQDRTDPMYSWMKTNHAGYHYWAGVYNNQNTYLAPWFLKAHENDDDIWMKLANGKVLKGAEWGQANIWNPDVRRYIQNYSEAQSLVLGGDPFLVCYDYTGEPHPWGAQPPGQPQYTGYNESAIRAFQDYLKAKFGTIAKLNNSWRSNYGSFEAIQPPPDPYISPPERATPLTYEFERFRCDSHAQYWKLVYDAYRKHDRIKPIEANAGMFMSGWPVEGLDAYQLQKTGVADWVDMHMNNFPPNLPEQIYLYSLCRLTGKVPVEFEYVWTFPRTGPVDETNESDFRATCQASVWRNLVWGKRVLVFFDFYYDWPAYHNAFFDQFLAYSILRPSACVVPVTKRKALRFNEILMTTEVATPPIIVLEPTASVLNSPPLHPNQSFSYHTGVAREIHELLFPKNYPFLYVPEQAILDGYSLQQHKVIILPQAPYLPDQMTVQLLKWVTQGGTLICLGLPGIWNPYGEADLRIVNQVFGPSEVADEQPGKWKWRWQIKNLKATRTVTDADGKLKAAFATYGKGRVLVSTGAFNNTDLQHLFYEILDSAIGKKPADCAKNSFELVLREDKHRNRYLFVLNPHTREIREDELILDGRFARCMDLGIGSGVPMPVGLNKAETKLTLRLHPGEGTVIQLSR